MRTWTDAFNEHKLLTYATAIAMRAFIGLAGLGFLTISLLGLTGNEGVWDDHIAPAIQPKVTQPTFHALDAAVHKIFSSDSLGLIAFASLFAVWQVSGSIRAVMDALNAIIETEETRPTWVRFALSAGLAVVVILLVGCALFVVAVTGRLLGASGGVAHWLVGVLRWPVAAVFLGLAVGVVARFGPAEHRSNRWASVGATLIVVTWLIVSAVYAWFLENVASYKSASGNLLVIMMITTYLYVSSIVFLLGAQLDELLREGAKEHETVGIRELARQIFS